MKKITILLVAMLSFLLVSCGTNGTSKKAVEEGKIAAASKEYEKARDLFKLAVDEDSKNSEAKLLLDLLNDYIDLTELVNTGEFDKVDELISNIEKNEKMELIKDDFQKTKDSISEAKDKIGKYSDEITNIENLLKDGNIDEAKSLATTKLEEVKGIKALEDKLNSIITSVDEKIASAKAEILKYYKGKYDIKYKNMEIYANDSNVSELKGKAILRFIEDQQYGSPKEYMYRMEDGAIFQLDQGSYYWVNNNNKVIYEVVDPSTTKTNNNVNVTISKEKVTEIALNYYYNHYSIPDKDRQWYFATVSDNALENEYLCIIQQAIGEPFAKYYVNATTGEVRVDSQRH